MDNVVESEPEVNMLIRNSNNPRYKHHSDLPYLSWQHRNHFSSTNHEFSFKLTYLYTAWAVKTFKNIRTEVTLNHHRNQIKSFTVKKH